MFGIGDIALCALNFCRALLIDRNMAKASGHSFDGLPYPKSTLEALKDHIVVNQILFSITWLRSAWTWMLQAGRSHMACYDDTDHCGRVLPAGIAIESRNFKRENPAMDRTSSALKPHINGAWAELHSELSHRKEDCSRFKVSTSIPCQRTSEKIQELSEKAFGVLATRIDTFWPPVVRKLVCRRRFSNSAIPSGQMSGLVIRHLTNTQLGSEISKLDILGGDNCQIKLLFGNSSNAHRSLLLKMIEAYVLPFFPPAGLEKLSFDERCARSLHLLGAGYACSDSRTFGPYAIRKYSFSLSETFRSPGLSSIDFAGTPEPRPNFTEASFGLARQAPGAVHHRSLHHDRPDAIVRCKPDMGSSSDQPASTVIFKLHTHYRRGTRCIWYIRLDLDQKSSRQYVGTRDKHMQVVIPQRAGSPRLQAAPRHLHENWAMIGSGSRRPSDGRMITYIGGGVAESSRLGLSSPDPDLPHTSRLMCHSYYVTPHLPYPPLAHFPIYPNWQLDWCWIPPPDRHGCVRIETTGVPGEVGRALPGLRFRGLKHYARSRADSQRALRRDGKLCPWLHSGPFEKTGRFSKMVIDIFQGNNPRAVGKDLFISVAFMAPIQLRACIARDICPNHLDVDAHLANVGVWTRCRERLSAIMRYTVNMRVGGFGRDTILPVPGDTKGRVHCGHGFTLCNSPDFLAVLVAQARGMGSGPPMVKANLSACNASLTVALFGRLSLWSRDRLPVVRIAQPWRWESTGPEVVKPDLLIARESFEVIRMDKDTFGTVPKAHKDEVDVWNTYAVKYGVRINLRIASRSPCCRGDLTKFHDKYL
ncbi:uncharacterized protein CLUP02_00108 [Colletotrichum lupini]|uniref:Uncharacterized protein n=1 Tax=Colletotrichum lupini TaxID=145971 RepID=A0A9Q8W7I8_9PEZI|nr:uncharacterized protein CLUP02_00108 [Colletotrichum lupini]UQC73464.1 hypothetical protein CLUP02_00108 [Colletotrichum lupini]